MTTKTKVQVDGPAIVLCKAITFHDRLKNSPEILKKMPYFLGDLLDLCCGVEKCSKALLISPIVGKILLLWLWLWLLLGDWKSESPLFSRPKTMLWTTRCVAAHLLGSWIFLVEKDAEFSAAQLKGSMISWAKWPMFQVLGGATKRYRCLGSRCYPCQPPPKKTLQVTGTSCTSRPRPQPLMELWAIFLEDSQGGRPPKPLQRDFTRLEIFSDSSFRVEI